MTMKPATKQKKRRHRMKLINCLHNLGVRVEGLQKLETVELQNLVYKHYEVINNGNCLS